VVPSERHRRAKTKVPTLRRCRVVPRAKAVGVQYDVDVLGAGDLVEELPYELLRDVANDLRTCVYTSANNWSVAKTSRVLLLSRYHGHMFASQVRCCVVPEDDPSNRVLIASAKAEIQRLRKVYASKAKLLAALNRRAAEKKHLLTTLAMAHEDPWL